MEIGLGASLEYKFLAFAGLALACPECDKSVEKYKMLVAYGSVHFAEA